MKQTTAAVVMCLQAILTIGLYALGYKEAALTAIIFFAGFWSRDLLSAFMSPVT